jgi:hypothetical protein
MHLFCKPAIVLRNGEEHFGLDAFMRCRVCRKRTANHFECEALTPALEQALRREWRFGPKVEAV